MQKVLLHKAIVENSEHSFEISSQLFFTEQAKGLFIEIYVFGSESTNLKVEAGVEPE